MGRIIAIDHGNKKVGLAVTDPLKLIANGLTTIHSSKAVDFLKDYIEKEDVDAIVVGDPRQDDGTPSSHAEAADNFAKHLSRVFPEIPIEREEEWNTSQEARNSMIQSGLSKKKRQDKTLVDEISATLILQAFMDRKKDLF